MTHRFLFLKNSAAGNCNPMTSIPKSTSSPIFKLILWWVIGFVVIKLLENPIINSVTLFLYGPIIFFGYAGLVYCFVASIVYWVRKRNIVSRPFIPFVFTILATCFIAYFPFNALTLRIDFQLKLSEREKIVTMINNKTISCDTAKTTWAKIPREYSNLSAGSPDVLVENIDGTTCIFFYTFRGITDNFSGFVWVGDERVMSKITIGQFGVSRIFYEPIEIIKFAAHWYFIANT